MSESELPNYDHLKAQWHPTKNGEFQFTDFTVGSGYRAHWICNESDCGCPHEWPAEIKARTNVENPTGCPFCSPCPRRVCYHNSLAYLRPDLMKEWDYEKNMDIDPYTLSVSSHIVVAWTCPNVCPIGGCKHEWPSKIQDRTYENPRGCPYCAPNSTVFCYHQTLEYLYPGLADEWNTDKNGQLKPSEVTPGSDKRVWWTCNKNSCHQWKAIIKTRTYPDRQSGCPFCKNKTEGEVLEWLSKQFPGHTIKPHEPFDWCRGEKSNCCLPYDFYIVELNKIIELDGPQHFKDVSNWRPFKETRKIDIYKMKLALEQGIAVIRITQTMFKRRKAEMRDILLPHILNEKLKYVFLSEGNEYRNHKTMLTNALKYAK